jgi:predicted ribosome quality control (RQC) complex YloA/Tae2 family protein
MHFREFTSPNRYKIMVGKNAKANDELSFEIADKDDLWFHVSDIRGPHVIMRFDEAIKREDIRFAAQLAVRYSKASGKNKVDYCHIRDLCRTKTLGCVIVSNVKTVIV